MTGSGWVGDRIGGNEKRCGHGAASGPMKPCRPQAGGAALVMKDAGQNANGGQYRQRNTPMHDALLNQPHTAQAKQSGTDEVGMSGNAIEEKLVSGDATSITELAEQCGSGETVGGGGRPCGQRQRKTQQDHGITHHGGIENILSQTTVGVLCQTNGGQCGHAQDGRRYRRGQADANEQGGQQCGAVVKLKALASSLGDAMTQAAAKDFHQRTKHHQPQ